MPVVSAHKAVYMRARKFWFISFPSRGAMGTCEKINLSLSAVAATTFIVVITALFFGFVNPGHVCNKCHGLTISSEKLQWLNVSTSPSKPEDSLQCDARKCTSPDTKLRVLLPIFCTDCTPLNATYESSDACVIYEWAWHMYLSLILEPIIALVILFVYRKTCIKTAAWFPEGVFFLYVIGIFSYVSMVVAGGAGLGLVEVRCQSPSVAWPKSPV